MPVFKKNNLNEQLLMTQTVFNSALANPEILQVLSGFNFSEKRLNEGLQLYTEVSALSQKQQMEYNEQYEASRKFTEAADLADEKYMFNLKLARVVFKNNSKAQDDLKMNGHRKESFTGWYNDAVVFYNSLINNQEYLSAMNTYGVQLETLKTEYNSLQQLLNLNNSYLKEKGEAVESTRLRDEQIDKLNDYMSDLIKICKLAFAKRPEVLKQLGLQK